jgi:hypothetical protein
LNNDNETYVVKQKVLKWIDEGKTTSQIASMWNAGEGNENAYQENWRGTNSHGVSYDTPTYAKNVVNYAKEFYTQNQQAAQSQKDGTSADPSADVPTQAPATPVAQAPTPSPTQLPTGGLLGQATSPSRLQV